MMSHLGWSHCDFTECKKDASYSCNNCYKNLCDEHLKACDCSIPENKIKNLEYEIQRLRDYNCKVTLEDNAEIDKLTEEKNNLGEELTKVQNENKELKAKVEQLENEVETYQKLHQIQIQKIKVLNNIFKEIHEVICMVCKPSGKKKKTKS